MRNYWTLSAGDVPLLLYLHLYPSQSYAELGARLSMSKSTVHEGVRRLVRSHLVHVSSDGSSEVAFDYMMQFLEYAVSFMFQPVTVERARGVPTGFSAPILGDLQMDQPRSMVWPSRLGDVQGLGVMPLWDGAPEVALRDAKLYELLALVDALRMGDARERGVAREALERVLRSTEALHVDVARCSSATGVLASRDVGNRG